VVGGVEKVLKDWRLGGSFRRGKVFPVSGYGRKAKTQKKKTKIRCVPPGAEETGEKWVVG